MNLNKISANILHGVGVQKFEPVWWYKNLGQQNNKGVVTPIYAPPLPMQAKIQSLSADALQKVDDMGQSTKRRYFYLDGYPEGLPSSAFVTPLSRENGQGGDLLYARNQWWLVDELPEDFTMQGWCKVGATLQNTPPTGVDAPVVA